MSTFKVRNQNGETFDVDESRITEAEADGFLPVVSNGTEEHRVSYSDLGKARQDGFSPVFSKPSVSGIESGLRGLAQGASNGFADEITAGLESALTSKTYDQSLKESREAYKAQEEANPMTYMGSQLVGGVGSALVPGLNVAKLGTMGGRAQLAQGLGQASGVGYSEADNIQDLQTDAAIGGALGGVFQVGGEKVAPVLGKGMNKLKQLGKGAVDYVDEALLPGVGKVFSGVSPEDTKFYLANADQVNSEQRSVERVKTELDDVITDIFNQRSKAKEGLASAQDALKTQQAAARDSLADERYMTSMVRSELKDQFDDQSRKAFDALEKKTLAPIRDQILQGMEELKSRVSYQSGEAFNILDKAAKKDPTKSVSLAPVLSELDRGISELLVGGVPVGDSANQSVRNLTALKERLSSLPDGKLSLTEAKKVIQSIDADQVFAQQKGSFSPEADAVKAKLRHIIDLDLKTQVPAYKEKMLEVSKNTELLSEMSKGYGTEGGIVGRLQALGTERGKLVELPRLKRFQDATGIKFQSEIDEFLAQQKVLDSDVLSRELKDSLSSAQPYKESVEHSKRLADPAVRRELMESVSKSAEASNVKLAEDALELADQDVAKLKGWNTLGTESRIKALMQNRNNIENERVLSYLSEKTGKDYRSQLDLIRTRDAFDKGNTNGSRNTLLGAMTGNLAGAVIGGATGAVFGGDIGGIGAGGAAGAILGFTFDKQAGRVFKMLLDGRLKADVGAQALAQSYGKYAKPLADAAARGNKALAQTHFILSQKSPDYQEMMKRKQEEKGE